MYEIKRYTESQKEEWNDFITDSKNGTFLTNRNYMEYHSDRFHDFSLMFYSKNKLSAVLPGNIIDNTFYSHKGLTYGGLITDSKCKTADVCHIFEETNAYLKEQGIRKIVYKPAPWIYFTLPAEEDLYAITNVCHARITGRDISSTIVLGNKLKFGELRRRCMKKAKADGIEIRESEDIETFWKILDNNLENKYGVPPVHTCDELKLLAGRFPENIKLYMAYLGEEALGGTVTYINKSTVHTQYISASPKGKATGALDLLFYELINNVFKDYTYFDFGKSTEREGTYLNENLIFQKEGFGGRGVCYDTYEWEL